MFYATDKRKNVSHVLAFHIFFSELLILSFLSLVTHKKIAKKKETKCNLLCALLIFWANYYYSWIFKVIRPVA